MASTDVFGFQGVTPSTPLTADKAILMWGGGIVTGATNIAINYAQQVNRRRTIGNKSAIIWASMPSGQITMQRLLTTDTAGLFSAPGWRACQPGQIILDLAGACTGGVSAGSYTATGCIVSQFAIQAEAESLTVMDNVTIEFLQLSSNLTSYGGGGAGIGIAVGLGGGGIGATNIAIAANINL